MEMGPRVQGVHEASSKESSLVWFFVTRSTIGSSSWGDMGDKGASLMNERVTLTLGEARSNMS